MNNDEKVEQLEQAIESIERDITDIRDHQCECLYGKMTIGEIGKKWDKSSPADRWNMVRTFPQISQKITRWADSMGCEEWDIEKSIGGLTWKELDYMQIHDEFIEYCMEEQ